MIVITNYNTDPSWVMEYTDDYIIYDRSSDKSCIANIPVHKVKHVENIGSDNYDRMKYIIDNYDNLPDVVQLLRGRLFKYITKEEYEVLKDNKTFTPLLTKGHPTDDFNCFYRDGIYWERNDGWYLEIIPIKDKLVAKEMATLLGINGMKYLPFAPGCNYILPKENILKHPKELYEKLLKYLEWHVWPAEAAILERGLYTLWK